MYAFIGREAEAGSAERAMWPAGTTVKTIVGVGQDLSKEGTDRHNVRIEESLCAPYPWGGDAVNAMLYNAVTVTLTEARLRELHAALGDYLAMLDLNASIRAEVVNVAI